MMREGYLIDGRKVRVKAELENGFFIVVTLIEDDEGY